MIKINDDKKDELEKRTIIVLEKTKKRIVDYGRERNTLYKYFKECQDLDKWEEYLKKIEKLIENL